MIEKGRLIEKELINELTDYVKNLKSRYELEKAQEWQKGYSMKVSQKEN